MIALKSFGSLSNDEIMSLANTLLPNKKESQEVFQRNLEKMIAETGQSDDEEGRLASMVSQLHTDAAELNINNSVMTVNTTKVGKSNGLDS